jgi:thiamine biosynthesis lipoprotein
MISRCKPLLGTFVKIKTKQENSSTYQAVEEALEEIKEIHNLMSFFEQKSQLSLLNCQAHSQAHKQPIKVDERLFEVLLLTQKLFKESNGIFDVTLHRSKREYGCTFLDVELLENFQVRFKKPLQIDLGGIAKGYAVDRAAQILESQNIKNYVINAGGDLRVGKET